MVDINYKYWWDEKQAIIKELNKYYGGIIPNGITLLKTRDRQDKKNIFMFIKKGDRTYIIRISRESNLIPQINLYEKLEKLMCEKYYKTLATQDIWEDRQYSFEYVCEKLFRAYDFWNEKIGLDIPQRIFKKYIKRISKKETDNIINNLIPWKE